MKTSIYWLATLSIGLTSLLVLAACGFVDESGAIKHGSPEILTALATLEPAAGGEVRGTVKLMESKGVGGPKLRDAPATVEINLFAENLPGAGPFMVGLRSGPCSAPGVRHDPGGKAGSGTLGTLTVDGRSGELRKNLEELTVDPESKDAVVGKSIVVEDASGKVLACGMLSPS